MNLSFVFGPIDMLVNALPVSLIVKPRSLVDVAVPVNQLALAAAVIIDPVSFVAKNK